MCMLARTNTHTHTHTNPNKHTHTNTQTYTKLTHKLKHKGGGEEGGLQRKGKGGSSYSVESATAWKLMFPS